MRETCHCGEPTHTHEDGFTRGLCLDCDTVRCDIEPGECWTKRPPFCSQHPGVRMRWVHDMSAKPFLQCPLCQEAFIAALDFFEIQQIIAVELDKPSVYMGGPSKRSSRLAEDILLTLDFRGYKVVKK